MDELEKFYDDKKKNITDLGNDQILKDIANQFMVRASSHKYDFNFEWLGRPIIQYPQDIIAMQEIIWRVKPDLIIETGIAHGGSIVFYASMLEIIGNGEVLGIDKEIRPHNKELIENHEMFKRITMIEGDSISERVIEEVKKICSSKKKILVVLDSYHTHDFVLKELELYSQFVSVGSFLIVYDTVVEDYPEEYFESKPWGKGNNPKTAVWKFLEERDDFVIDLDIENKLVITVAPNGYLKRVK